MMTEHSEKKLRLVKRLDEYSGGENQISSAVLQEAAKNYSPEEVEKMVARGIEFRKRRTVRRVAVPTEDHPTLKGEPGRASIGSTPPVGPPSSRVTMVCPTCKIPVSDDAYGYVRDPDKPGSALPCPACSPRVKALRAARSLQKDLQGLFGGANVPDMARNWTFETFPPTGDQFAKQQAQMFANQETVQRGLYLWGDPGRGKTCLAICVLREFLARGETGFFIRSSRYIRLLRNAERGIDTKEGNSLLDLAFSVACLVLDDLAVESTTDYVIRQYYDLIEERRMSNGLYTVITSNKSIDELEERWRPQGVAPGEFHEGTRVVERLRESWGEVEVLGPNQRTANYQDEGGE